MEDSEKKIRQEDCNEDTLGSGILTITNKRIAFDKSPYLIGKGFFYALSSVALQECAGFDLILLFWVKRWVEAYHFSKPQTYSGRPPLRRHQILVLVLCGISRKIHRRELCSHKISDCFESKT